MGLGSKNKKSIRHYMIVLWLGLLLAAGCQASLSQLLPFASSTPTPENTLTPTITPQKTPNTAADTITTIPESSIITLTLWIPEKFTSPDGAFSQQVASFEADHADIVVELFPKRMSGQASTVNFLKSTQPVAPSVLPDIVILSTDELPMAWRGKLIQPLDGLLDRTIVQDLLPIAQQLVTIDENMVAVSFEFGLEHAVYNTGKVFTTPVTWASVVSQTTNYQFPADGQNGLLNDSLLIQYLSTGAVLVSDEGKPVIDEPALRNLLTYYQTLVTGDITDPRIVDSAYAKKLWDDYLAGLINITHVSSYRYLSDRRLLASTAVSPIPAQAGNTTTIGRGWAFALVTSDPIRQNAALKFIESFMQTEENAAWAVHSAAIPTRQSAFDQVAGDDPYWQFLRSYLETAQPPPSFAGYDQLSRILFVAIKQVISGEATPDEAIDTAIQALEQTTS
jgi:multiple sugar transport system substrate-binding protein